MRIAYLAGLFPVRSETPVVNQITGLVARGHDVAIYGDRPKVAGPYHESIDTFGLLAKTSYRPDVPATLAGRWAGVRRLLRQHHGASRRVLLRSLNPLVYAGRAVSGKLAYQAASFLPPSTVDIIHAGFGEQGVKALRMMRLGALQGPLVTAFRGADLTKYPRNRRNVYRRLFLAGDRFLPVSQYFADTLAQMGCPADRTIVLRTGINIRLFDFRPRVHAPSLRVVSVGRLVEKKAIQDALRMIANLKALGLAVTYDIIGDGPLRSSLEQLTGTLGIEDRVRFLGAQDQARVPMLLAGCQVLVTPSVTAADGDQEGIPNVIKEAMASGLAVIATRHAGIPELVEDGVTGLLVPEHDPDALTSAARTLHDRPEMWAPMIQAARKKVEDEYDIERQNDRLVAIYQDVIAERGMRSR